MAQKEQRYTIRCDSRPWCNTTKWMTITEARDLAYGISEDAYNDDVDRWGQSRQHDVYVMNHEENTIALTVAFKG